MAITLTAKGIQHSGGTFGQSSQSQTTTPFMYHWIDANSYTFTGSWVQYMQTPDWQTPAKTQGILYHYVPTRYDNGSWGGAKVRLYYRLNSGSWVDTGNSGYAQNDSTMSHSGDGRIDHQCQSHQFNFSDQTSDFTVGFRFDIADHDGPGGYVNGDSGIDNGGAIGNNGHGGKHDASGNWSNQGGSTGKSHCAWLGQGYE